MSRAMVWTIGIIIVVVVGGLIAFQATAPQDDSLLPVTISPTVDEEENGLGVLPVGTLGATDTTETEYTSPTVSPTAATTTNAVVNMSDTSFSPSTLTVAVGTTVTFTNNGQGNHWPASDPHPTHTGLAGFDAKQGLATGESYSFTFTKAGTFGYHDHLNPSLRGTITVQ